jgi:hypothetical protein
MATLTKKTAVSGKEGRGNAWFSRGEEAAKKARAQAASTFKPELWMYNGETARIIFLDKESFNVHVHSIKIRGRVRKYTCLRHKCPLCKTNDSRLVAVYRVLDLRKFEKKDKDGNPVKGSAAPYKEKYYEVGSRLQPVVARLMAAKRLYKKLSELSRDGEGTATTYQLIPIGPIGPKLRAKVEAMLTPKLPLETDYAPKPAAELRELAGIFGEGGADDDEDDAEPTTSRSYLEDEDEDE